MKKLFTTLLLMALSIAIITPVQASQTLQDNEAYLYYMYSNKEGHYFLEPNSEFENVIFIGHSDFKFSKLRHGKKYIGIFEDQTKWDLENIIEVK